MNCNRVAWIDTTCHELQVTAWIALRAWYSLQFNSWSNARNHGGANSWCVSINSLIKNKQSKNRRICFLLFLLFLLVYGFGLSPFAFDKSNTMLAISPVGAHTSAKPPSGREVDFCKAKRRKESAYRYFKESYLLRWDSIGPGQPSAVCTLQNDGGGQRCGRGQGNVRCRKITAKSLLRRRW